METLVKDSLSSAFPNCSALLPSLLLVGPGEEFASLGGWAIPMFSILFLAFLPVWVVGLSTLHIIRTQAHPSLLPSLSWLACLPPSLLLFTSIGILLPDLGTYVELLLEISLSLGLVKFVQLALAMCGGVDTLVQYCKERDTGLPIGSPPIVCLMPFPKPPVTQNNLSVVCLAPSLLLATKVTILAIEVAYLCLGHNPSESNFLAWDNAHNLLSIPAGIFGIYFFNMFMSLIGCCMGEHPKKNLGFFLLLQYILFDCLKLFVSFLLGTNMISCVPPFLQQEHIGHMLKNIIKAFLAAGLGLPFLKIVAGKSDPIPQLVQTTPISLENPSFRNSEPRPQRSV